MFQETTPAALLASLNEFNVPMFAAERAGPKSPFRLIAINKAHEKQSGMRQQDIENKSLQALLPADQAREVAHRYARCADRRADYRYSEVLEMPVGRVVWNTALQFVELPDGGERVLGNAVLVHKLYADGARISRFQDVRSFSMEASFQLQKVSEMLQVFEEGRIDGPEDQVASVKRLAELCDSINTTLESIRQTAASGSEELAHTSTSLLRPVKPGSRRTGGRAVRNAAVALIDIVHNSRRDMVRSETLN